MTDDFLKELEEYKTLDKEIKARTKRKEEIHKKIVAMGKDLIPNDFVQIIIAKSFDTEATMKVWNEKGMDLPMKKIPETTILNMAVFQAQSEDEKIAKYTESIRVNIKK